MVRSRIVWWALRLALKPIWNIENIHPEKRRGPMNTESERKRDEAGGRTSEQANECFCTMYIMTCRRCCCCWCQYYRFNIRQCAVCAERWDPFNEMPFNREPFYLVAFICTEKWLFTFISNETVWIELIFKRIESNRIEIDLLFTFQCFCVLHLIQVINCALRFVRQTQISWVCATDLCNQGHIKCDLHCCRTPYREYIVCHHDPLNIYNNATKFLWQEFSFYCLSDGGQKNGEKNHQVLIMNGNL